MAMVFPANPNTIEAAYMKVMTNLLVAVNVCMRPLPNDVKIDVITVEPTGKASFCCLKLHADETSGSIQWKMTHWPRLCVRARFNFMTRTYNLLYLLHPIYVDSTAAPQATLLLVPSGRPLRAEHENLVLSNELIKIEVPP